MGKIRQMKSPITQEIRNGIQARKGNLQEVVDATGVPYSTLVKIGQGVVANPRIKTVEALMKHFGIQCSTSKKKAA